MTIIQDFKDWYGENKSWLGIYKFNILGVKRACMIRPQFHFVDVQKRLARSLKRAGFK